MKLITATAIALAMTSTAAHASPIPQPMRDAVDAYATEYATFQEWNYVDRNANVHGDYRRARFTLIYTIPQNDPNTEVIMEVEARAVRCAFKSYAISTPLDTNNCPGRLPRW